MNAQKKETPPQEALLQEILSLIKEILSLLKEEETETFEDESQGSDID